MEHASIADAVIANRGLNFASPFGGGYGGGYGGGVGVGNQVLAADAHANGTAVDAKIESIQDGQRLAFDSIQEQIRESRNLDQFTRLSDNQFRAEIRGSDQHAGVVKGVADAEFRSIDRQRDITAMLVDNAKEAAKCCCDTQKLIVAEGNETRALVLAVEGRASVAALAMAQAKITQLETIDALSRRRG